MPSTEDSLSGSNASPVGFVNASPFPRRSKQRDRVKTALLVGAGIAVLALLIAIGAVLSMHGPVL